MFTLSLLMVVSRHLVIFTSASYCCHTSMLSWATPYKLLRIRPWSAIEVLPHTLSEKDSIHCGREEKSLQQRSTIPKPQALYPVPSWQNEWKLYFPRLVWQAPGFKCRARAVSLYFATHVLFCCHLSPMFWAHTSIRGLAFGSTTNQNLGRRLS